MNLIKCIVFLSIVAAPITLNEVTDHITLAYIFFTVYLPTHPSSAATHGLLLTSPPDVTCVLMLLLTPAMLRLPPLPFALALTLPTFILVLALLT